MLRSSKADSGPRRRFGGREWEAAIRYSRVRKRRSGRSRAQPFDLDHGVLRRAAPQVSVDHSVGVIRDGANDLRLLGQFADEPATRSMGLVVAVHRLRATAFYSR